MIYIVLYDVVRIVIPVVAGSSPVVHPKNQ